MTQVGSENKLDAARHEAGHAVVSSCSGHKPQSMHIRAEDGRWVGDYGLEPEKVNLQDLAAIAIAGALAQVKTVAERDIGTAITFDKSSDLKELIRIIGDLDRISQPVNPGSCDLQVIADETKRKIRFDGAYLSGADAGKYRQARRGIPGSDEVDKQLIRSVMEDLDDPLNWGGVCALAEALCDQTPTVDERYELDGGAIAEIIARSDSAA